MPHYDQEHQRRTNARLRRACLVAVPLVGIAILAAGCSGSSSGTGAVASSSSGSSSLSQALKYTECMRSHGIADFPDPGSNGQITVTLNGPNSDLSPSNPKFQAAEAGCKSLQPSGGTPVQQQQNYTAELRYAHCMQARGVPVPDPAAPGSGANSQNNSGNTGSDSVNPNSPQFIAANKSCQHYLPAGGQGPSLNGGGS